MRSFCFTIILSMFAITTVKSYCILVNCRTGFVPVGNTCRRRVGRSLGDEGCYGSDKIFINDSVLLNPGPVVIECPEGYVFNENMDCRVEGWEPNSGPWETHHYDIGGRSLVLSVKRSSQSVRVRYVGLDDNKK